MTSFAGAAFAIALLANLVAVIGWATVAWLLGRRLGRVNIIDVFWGPGFGLIAVVTAVVAVITGTGNGVRQIVLLVLVLGWGSRLGWHVGRRSAGHGEDPRYADLLRKHGQDRDRTVWTFVYLPQMFTLYIVSLSVQVAMFIKPGEKVQQRDHETMADFTTRIEKAAVFRSLENLLTFPFVKTRVERGELQLHGAYFGVAEGSLFVLDQATKEFRGVRESA